MSTIGSDNNIQPVDTLNRAAGSFAAGSAADAPAADAPVLGVIVASTSPGRVGGSIGDWLEKQAIDHGGFGVKMLDLQEVDLPFHDESAHPMTGTYAHPHTRRWAELVDSCDAFVLVMPVYNYSYSAPLKNALDFVKREWKYKPVGFCSYGGTFGRIRAVEAIKPLLVAHGMFAIMPSVSLQLARDLDSDRQVRSTELLESAATAMLDELAKLAPVLRQLRV